MSIDTAESPVVIYEPLLARNRKARVSQTGDPDRIAQADLDLRAARCAAAIKAAVAGPPLPAAIVDALRNLLPPVQREA